MGFVYILGAIIAAFFSWKKWGEKIRGEKIKGGGDFTLLVECSEFWYVVIMAISYPIAIPICMIWQVLELIYNKFNKKKNKVNEVN